MFPASVKHSEFFRVLTIVTRGRRTYAIPMIELGIALSDICSGIFQILQQSDVCSKPSLIRLLLTGIFQKQEKYQSKIVAIFISVLRIMWVYSAMGFFLAF